MEMQPCVISFSYTSVAPVAPCYYFVSYYTT